MLKIGGFSLKLPENCMILKKSWGQGGPPGSATGLFSPSVLVYKAQVQRLWKPAIMDCLLAPQRQVPLAMVSMGLSVDTDVAPVVTFLSRKADILRNL